LFFMMKLEEENQLKKWTEISIQNLSLLID
jgi:hypothetical protein